MTDSARIIFAGTPDFAVPSLQALLSSDHEVIAVYTQPDRPAGRGRQLKPSPVKGLALRHNVPVWQPEKLRQENDLAALEELQADILVVVAYGLLLPRRVLTAPRLGCVNVHASLLPRWRGAAPIHRCILAGDKVTGVTIMQMDQGLDTGPMLHQVSCKIEATETAGSLHDKLASLGARALEHALPGILDRSLRGEVQDDELANYAAKIEKTEALIDWHRSVEVIDRQVRAFNPWPVAQTRWLDKVVRIWQAQPLPEVTANPPGSVLAFSREGILIAAGRGSLRVTQLQLPGKRVMSAADFLNAHSLDGVIFA